MGMVVIDIRPGIGSDSIHLPTYLTHQHTTHDTQQTNTTQQNEGELARDLRIVLEKLGPTFIKLGQALSIRPDVVRGYFWVFIWCTYVYMVLSTGRLLPHPSPKQDPALHHHTHTTNLTQHPN